MNQPNFGLAVIPAMAGFLSFGKRAKVQEIQEEKALQLPAAIINTSDDVQTGVARYLLSSPLVTTVTRYMKKKEKQTMTGVAKYVLRQAIAERSAPAPTGVAKYLAKSAKQPPRGKKTGVDKYLAKQELALPNLAALTGVARYEAEQDLIAKRKAAAVLIQKYKKNEEMAAVAAKLAADEAFELSKNTAGQIETDLEIPAATRVGRYLQEQADIIKQRPKTTGVAKYLAKKIALDSQKQPVSTSKVSQYLRKQALDESKKPKPTGVAKYVSKQQAVVTTTKPKENVMVSGVARYLSAQALAESGKPVLSGVSKYLDKQIKLERENRLSLPDLSESQNLIEQHLEEDTEVSLEGEFIPAGDFVAPTGVSRYLQKQGKVVIAEVESRSATGVSRYLSKQTESPTKVSARPRTGVDRYLLNSAV